MEASRVAGGRVKATGLALFGGSRQLSDPVSAVSREETFSYKKGKENCLNPLHQSIRMYCVESP